MFVLGCSPSFYDRKECHILKITHTHTSVCALKKKKARESADTWGGFLSFTFISAF